RTDVRDGDAPDGAGVRRADAATRRAAPELAALDAARRARHAGPADGMAAGRGRARPGDAGAGHGSRHARAVAGLSLGEAAEPAHPAARDAARRLRMAGDLA